MTMPKSSITIDRANNSVRISRTYSVAVERAWHAWTDPETLATWWGPTGWSATPPAGFISLAASNCWASAALEPNRNDTLVPAAAAAKAAPDPMRTLRRLATFLSVFG